MKSSKKITRNFIEDYTSGDTQDQLDLKAPLNSPVFTGNVTVPNGINPNEAINKGQLDNAISSLDSNVLHTTGNETKNGNLTLNDTLYLPDFAALPGGLNNVGVDEFGAVISVPIETTSTGNVRITATNKTGVTIPKGSVVYINGAQGAKATIALAIADSNVITSAAIGITVAAIPNNGSDYVVIVGEIQNLNTSAFTNGDKVYLSPTIPGGLTSTIPVSPDNVALIGIVTNSHATQGKIVIRIIYTTKIDRLVDVSITTSIDKDLLSYEASSGLWKNKSATSLGILTAEVDTLQSVTDRSSTTTQNITANGFVKQGGTNAQFLKANGTIDSTVYQAASDAMTLSTAQSFTNTKSFNVANTSNPAFSLTNGLSGSSNSFAMLVSNSNNGFGIKNINSSTGTGIDIANIGTGAGLAISNSVSGRGLSIINSSNGNGIFAQNSSSGYATFLQNNSVGTGLRIDNSTAASGDAFVFSKNNIAFSNLNNAGEFTAKKLSSTLGSVVFGSTTMTEDLVKLNNAIASTGLYEFGSGGITMASTTTVNIGNVKGWVVNSLDPLDGNPTFVNYAGQLAVTPIFIGSAAATYFLIKPDSTLLMLDTRPTVTQRRDNIYLGVVGHPAGTLTGIGNSPDIIMNVMSQVRAMFEPTRFINGGVSVYPNSTNLTVANTAGRLYGLGIGFIPNGNNAPSVLDISANAPTTFQYRTQGTTTFANTTVADPGFYDLAGTRTAIAGSSNQATNQRFFLLQNGMIRAQYGQTIYSTLSAAVAAIQSEIFVTNINATNLGILIGILSIQKGCTDLSDVATAKFLNVSKFGEVVGAAGGASVSTVQNAYTNSATANPQLLTNTTNGSLKMRRGSAADTDSVLDVQNGAGTNKFSIFGNGVARFSGFTVATLPAGTVGDTAYVTDASGSVTYLGAIAGGGSTVVPVFYDGVRWVYH